MKQITRLDAVNKIIQIKSGERIASVGELDTLPQAVAANNELDLAVISIQTNFKWFYNTINNGTLLSDNNGEVALPTNLAYITVLMTDASVEPSWLRPITGKLYDTYNHTFNLGVSKTVYYCGKLVWEFEDLPVVFQNLAVAYARQEIAGGGSHFSPTRLQMEQQRFEEALMAANKFDNTLSGGRAIDSSLNRRKPPYNRGFL